MLTQLQTEIESSENIVTLQDLEHLPSPPTDPIPRLIENLRTAVLIRLRERGVSTRALGNLSGNAGPEGFKTAMNRALRDLSKRQCRLTVLLDEIEYMTPADAIDVREGAMPTIAQFLSSLRGLRQENSNFTFVLSGLTSAITESGRLYGRPNPLFAWAKSYYLTPLTRSEADEMAKTVGGRMGVRISPDGLSALCDASGGHAFLYRHLASHVIGTLPLDVFERTLSGVDVLRSLESWRQLVAGVIREMIDHVSRYYPEEAFLLEILRTDSAYFTQVAQEEPLPLAILPHSA